MEGLWNLFAATGAPELYVIYRRQAEENRGEKEQ